MISMECKLIKISDLGYFQILKDGHQTFALFPAKSRLTIGCVGNITFVRVIVR